VLGDLLLVVVVVVLNKLAESSRSTELTSFSSSCSKRLPALEELLLSTASGGDWARDSSSAGGSSLDVPISRGLVSVMAG